MPVSSALPSWDWKPVDGLYSLPYLQPEPQTKEESGYLTQAEWWELLFFIKKLDICEQQPIFQNLRESLDEVLQASDTGFVVGFEVGFFQGALDKGLLRVRLGLEVRECEGSRWGRGQML